MGNSLLIRLVYILLAAVLVFSSCARRGTVPSRGERVVMHEVKSGETLESIAEDYYGNPSRAEKLMKENNLGSYKVAEGAVVRVLLSPQDVEQLKIRKIARVPYNEGLEFASRGSYLEAIGRFQDAISTDPRFVDARYNLGVTYEKMKAYRKALPQFEEIVRLRPTNYVYRFALGNCYFHMQQYDKAVDAFAAVVKLEPEHPQARYSLAAALEKLGRKKEALEAWEEYLRLDSTSEWAREARRRLEKLKQ
jgi:tetratricopeptide (TPR) repeat protein